MPAWSMCRAAEVNGHNTDTKLQVHRYLRTRCAGLEQPLRPVDVRLPRSVLPTTALSGRGDDEVATNIVAVDVDGVGFYEILCR